VINPALRYRLSLGARVFALVGTGYFLVATSAPYTPSSHQSCTHQAQTVTFHVTGTCGPEGDITATSPANDCTIAIAGAAAVGLPSAGRFDGDGADTVSLSQSAWTLSGYLPEATIINTSADAGIFSVVTDGGSGAGHPVNPDAGVFFVERDGQADLAVADGRVFTIVQDAEPSVDLEAAIDSGVFTVARDAQAGPDVGTPNPSGAGGSPSPVARHGKLILRSCTIAPGRTSSSGACDDNDRGSCRVTLETVLKAL